MAGRGKEGQKRIGGWEGGGGAERYVLRGETMRLTMRNDASYKAKRCVLQGETMRLIGETIRLIGETMRRTLRKDVHYNSETTRVDTPLPPLPPARPPARPLRLTRARRCLTRPRLPTGHTRKRRSESVQATPRTAAAIRAAEAKQCASQPPPPPPPPRKNYVPQKADFVSPGLIPC